MDLIIIGGTTICLATIVAILVAYYLFGKSMTFFKDKGIPCVPSVPVLGNLAPVILRRIDMIELLRRIYDFNPDAKYVGFYSLMTPILMLRDPELIKSVGVKNFENFPNHRVDVSVTHDPLVSKNLVMLKGQQWKDVRSLLSPAFTTSRIRAMYKLISQCSVDFVEFLQDLPPDKRDLDIKDIFSRFTNDVIACCAFGIKVDSMRHPNNEFYMNGKKSNLIDSLTTIKFVFLSIFPKLSRWLGIRMINKNLADFFKNVIADIIETRDKTGTSQPDMIQLMMDSRGNEINPNKDLNLDDMTSQAFVFFSAGFETTSGTLCFAAHELAVNPEVQVKLQQEIDEVLRLNGDEVPYEAINEMKYLDAVINETLRMYPVAFVTDRVCEKSFVLPPALPGGQPLTVEPGMNIWFATYPLQHDPKYFEEPERFLPERFIEEDRKNLHQGVFLSFGIGPRMCIGNRFAILEMKVLLFHLLAKCNLKACSKTAIPMKFSKTKPMYADGGFWLKLENRCDDVLK